MKYYEIVLMIHPDKSDKVKVFISNYNRFIVEKKGKVHRTEDWGRRQLAYPIKKLQKAHYILMNIELSSNYIHEVRKKIQFDNFIIRHLIMCTTKNNITPSIMMNAVKEQQQEKRLSPVTNRSLVS
ncbi:30S ribosomal protein S6 [Buchnera aphidicola]|uniref:Small ribosomal subunit protein bS6 n=1 Tax=Buchnera aphidicola (Anoecia oenotherae) TaxID=1241833 RepID=A0A4D6XRB7_9GAMM|nr:30S ribosomal protein S6 [Buchnera aphidicola]QCI19553.1 30S ribosomal protein S6 [Buchnera aphidicola (Anoecia oenotherae)]